MQLFQQSEATAAQRRLFFHAVDATDGIAAETGLTGTGYLSKNGATPAATSASLSELSSSNMPGRYYIEFTAAELNTVGVIEFRYKAAACAEVVARAMVVPFDPFDAVRLGLTALPNAAAEAAGGLYTRGTGAGQIDQPANGRIDVQVAAFDAGVIDAAAIGTGAIDADAIAADAIGASEFAQAAADKVWSTAARALTDKAGFSISGTLTTLDALENISAADVNTQVSDVLKTDTVTLPGSGAPTATPTMEAIFGYLYKNWRNKKTQTSSEWALYDDAGSTIHQKATVSDSAGTATKEEIASGP
jgi:hypothetical protein